MSHQEHKGEVTMFLESNPPAQELVQGLLRYGYSRQQITDMTYLTFEQINQIMRDNGLGEQSADGEGM